MIEPTDDMTVSQLRELMGAMVKRINEHPKMPEFRKRTTEVGFHLDSNGTVTYKAYAGTGFHYDSTLAGAVQQVLDALDADPLKAEYERTKARLAELEKEIGVTHENT